MVDLYSFVFGYVTSNWKTLEHIHLPFKRSRTFFFSGDKFFSFSFMQFCFNRLSVSKRVDCKGLVDFYSSMHTEATTSDVIAPSPWKIFGCQNGKEFSSFIYLAFKGYMLQNVLLCRTASFQRGKRLGFSREGKLHFIVELIDIL